MGLDYKVEGIETETADARMYLYSFRANFALKLTHEQLLSLPVEFLDDIRKWAELTHRERLDIMVRLDNYFRRIESDD